MVKISIIGAGNVGGLTAMRLLESGLEADIFLIDIVPGLAKGKVMDLEDASAVFKTACRLFSSENIDDLKDSDIVVVTAGLPRKPGMTREELLRKNAEVLKTVCLKVRLLAYNSILVVVTNPLDVMTYLALAITGFRRNKVIGMGASLDSARFTNLISRELNVPSTEVEALVIGAHGEGMLPLERLTRIRNVPFDKFLSPEKIDEVVKGVVSRGAEVVKNLGSGSAYFAPSAAIVVLVKAITRDEKKIMPVACCLEGEYGLDSTCIGVPCRIGRGGIEQVIELELTPQEKEKLHKSAEQIRESAKTIGLT